jgi:hypothetical protein
VRAKYLVDEITEGKSLLYMPFSALSAPSALSATATFRYHSITRGRLASTGLMKELQRAQVQVPG